MTILRSQSVNFTGYACWLSDSSHRPKGYPMIMRCVLLSCAGAAVLGSSAFAQSTDDGVAIGAGGGFQRLSFSAGEETIDLNAIGGRTTYQLTNGLFVEAEGFVGLEGDDVGTLSSQIELDYMAGAYTAYYTQIAPNTAAIGRVGGGVAEFSTPSGGSESEEFIGLGGGVAYDIAPGLSVRADATYYNFVNGDVFDDGLGVGVSVEFSF